MKLLFVDSITNSQNCFFAIWESGEILSSFIGTKEDIPKGYKNICFDYFKVASLFPDALFHDVKIFCDLAGHDTDILKDLSIEILGNSKSSEYVANKEKIDAYFKSFEIAKIKYGGYSLELLIPNDTLIQFYLSRAKVVCQIYESIEKDEAFYNGYFYSVLRTLYETSIKPLEVDLEAIKKDTSRFSFLLRHFAKDGKLYLRFNPVGAKTGRLSFKKGTVNLYVLPRELRSCIVAPQDYEIVQLDFKSFQPRLAIFCTGDDDFKRRFDKVDDIYSVFPGDREKNKISFISWMFSKRKDELFEKEASAILNFRRKLYYQAKEEGYYITPFDRVLKYNGEDDNVLLQNFVTATEVDAVLSLMVEISEKLKENKSRVIMPFHDSIIFYVHKDEKYLIPSIKKRMEEKHFDLFGANFPVSVKIGKNFGDMKEWKNE